MKLCIKIFVGAILLLIFAQPTLASDFLWMHDFNIQAQADPSGFRARLTTRFNLGDLQVQTVLGDFADPADAYIALRLGEMSGKPVDYVVEKYKSNKGKGWGSLAQSLGIAPGSAEFKELKEGHDLKEGKNLGSSSHHHNAAKSKKELKARGNGKKKNK